MRTVWLAIAGALILSGCGGGGGGGAPPTGGGGGGGGGGTASVAIQIVLPTVVTTARERKRLYISPYTQSATVLVTQGAQSATATINCDATAHVCKGSVNAPLGNDTFTVTLWTAANGTGKAVANGITTQNVVTGNNTLNITFNPVIGSVRLQFSKIYGDMPYLSSLGPSSADIDVLAVDAAGNTIVGPGNFVDTQGNALTVKVVDRDPAGHTSIAPSSFTAPAASANAVATVTLNGAPSPFEDADISVSVVNGSSQTVSGIGVQGMNVPVSPASDAGFGPVSEQGPGGGGPNMTSVYATFAMQLNVLVGGFYHDHATCTAAGGPDDGALTCPPLIDDLTQGPSVEACCKATPINPLGTVQDHLLGGVPAAGGGNDRDLWFVDEPDASTAFAGALSYADMTTATGASHDDVVPLPTSAPVTAMIADAAGNIWFSQEAASSAPLISEFSAASPPASVASVSLAADQTGGIVDGLVSGPSGKVFAIVSAGGNTYVDTLTLGTGPTVSNEAHTGLNLRPLTNGWQPIAGYSPADGNLYVADNGAGNVYQFAFSGSSLTVTKVASDGPGIANGDPNRQPMTVLPDGSLAYQGATPSTQYGPNPGSGGVDYYYVHIVPGRSPTPVSVIVPACTSAPCFLYSYWSIVLSGNNVIMADTNGGNTHAIIW